MEILHTKKKKPQSFLMLWLRFSRNQLHCYPLLPSLGGCIWAFKSHLGSPLQVRLASSPALGLRAGLPGGSPWGRDLLSFSGGGCSWHWACRTVSCLEPFVKVGVGRFRLKREDSKPHGLLSHQLYLKRGAFSSEREAAN